jgi:hypothetical protein
MSWGTRRRNTIIFLVIVVLIIPIMVGGFLLFYEAPNCFDGKKNADETGIDCGGGCELVCTQETLDPVIVWERFFEVSPGIYNVVAYIENKNPKAGVNNAPYIFKLFNKDDVLIASKTGSVNLKPKDTIPIIENRLNTIKQIPNRISFEFTNDLIFEKQDAQVPSIVVKDENYFIDSFPKVTAELQNITLKDVKDIDVVVLLFDVFDNVVATSSTFVESIPAEKIKDITFTWPISFDEDVSRIEIIPLYE